MRNFTAATADADEFHVQYDTYIGSKHNSLGCSKRTSFLLGTRHM